jgi:hypothetical protein
MVVTPYGTPLLLLFFTVECQLDHVNGRAVKSASWKEGVRRDETEHHGSHRLPLIPRGKPMFSMIRSQGVTQAPNSRTPCPYRFPVLSRYLGTAL